MAPVEFGLGFGGHDAAARCSDRFAKIGAARCALAVVGDGIAPGAHRIVVAPDPRQHRREHFPAAAIGRIFLKMGFNLRHQLVHRRGCDCGTAALRKREVAERRRAELRVERYRHQRQAGKRDHGNGAAER